MNCEKQCRYLQLLQLTGQFNLQDLNQQLVRVTENLVPSLNVHWDFHSDLVRYNAEHHVRLNLISLENKHVIEVLNRQHLLATISCDRPPDNEELHELQYILQVYSSMITHLTHSNIDPLTGVYNRHAFGYELNRMSKCLTRDARRRMELPKYLAMIDIDGFKQVNDQFGHLLGDEVLVIFGQKILSTFRDYDTCYRYGGEEFAIILNQIDHTEVASVLDRFRQIIEEHVFTQVGQLTISIGYSYIEPGFVPSELLDKADSALYFAKKHGKNQICNYEVLLNNGQISRRHHSDIEFW